MRKTAVVFTCAHADPKCSNERFDYLGKFIYDINPDYVIDLGDGADMASLNSYDDRYPKAVSMLSYEKDVKHYLDSQERLRHPFRYNKKKKPYWIGFEGNHENRIKRATELNPRIAGSRYGISFSHLETKTLFNEYHEYEHSAPSLHTYDGVLYGHYVSSGNFGRPLGSKHHAASLVDKLSHSATVGHSHKFHYYIKADARPRPLHGLVAGCYKGQEESWAGQANGDWTKGVAVKRYIEDGTYDLQWVSMEALKREYA